MEKQLEFKFMEEEHKQRRRNELKNKIREAATIISIPIISLGVIQIAGVIGEYLANPNGGYLEAVHNYIKYLFN